MAEPILAFLAQPPNPTPQLDPPDTTRAATAALVESLLAKSLAKDDLFGRLCGSLVVAKIRRGGQR